MMYLSIRRRMILATRCVAGMVVALVCLTTNGKLANASLIIRDRSESASSLAMPADPLQNWNDVRGSSAAADSTSEDGSVPEPVNALPTRSIFQLQYATHSTSGAGATDGASSIGGSIPMNVALCMTMNELPIPLAVRWFHAGRFEFVPFAPRSGLLRPPQTLA